MPYVAPQRREIIDRGTTHDGYRAIMPGDGLLNAGELTYVLQQVVRNYITDHGLSYTTLAEVLGALEGCKIDLTDRVLIPYERGRCVVNGDVWGKLGETQ